MDVRDTRKLPRQYVRKIRVLLAFLNSVNSISDLKAIPGGKLHRLTGDLKGFWSLSVSANWRIIFRFGEDNHIYDIDYVDYH